MAMNKDSTQSAAVSAWAKRELQRLQEDYHDYNPSSVPIFGDASSEVLSRQVARSFPCVFNYPRSTATPEPHNGIKPTSTLAAMHWAAEDLTRKVNEPIEVAVTPHGNADSLIPHPSMLSEEPNKQIFVQPAIRTMSMAVLLQKLSTQSLPSEPVYYLQSQDSNLTTVPSLAPLLSDLPSNLPFAKTVLGEPDARNIWIGDDRSVTSLHRDPYENLYLVLKGSKTFRLFAPVDEVEMPLKWVGTGRYVLGHPSSNEDLGANGAGKALFDVELDNPTGVDEEEQAIPWIDLDPLNLPSSSSLCNKMRTITVDAGQILYLPSGWYHHVTQRCGLWDDGSPAPCIAVNYWYDMDYEGERYVMRQMMSRLVEVARPETVKDEKGPVGSGKG